MQAAHVIDPDPSSWSIAYVMTHYPAVALTFIAGEIDELERAGGHIVPIAINRPPPSQLAREDSRRRASATQYLKSAVPSVATASLRCLLRHPIALPRLAFRAVRSARSDVALMVRRLTHLAYATLVAERCQAASVTHIHAQFGQAPATIAWFATEIRNFRATGNAGWSFTIHGFQDFVDEAVARLDLKAASARFVVCVSEFTRSQLCRITDVGCWPRYHVVRCGIDIDAFAFRGHQPMRPRPLIVIVGRLSPEKGHLVLFQAAALLRDRGLLVAIRVVGGGPFEDALRAEVASLSLEDQIHFTGEQEPDAVRNHLREADIFCLASFAEGLPISIMEAMAIGVPVITTWISGIPELAINGTTALAVAPGDANALAGAIQRMAGEAAPRVAMVIAARAAVEQHHRRDVNARTLAMLFHATLADERRASSSNSLSAGE